MFSGFQITFDAADPERLASFWGEALGYVEQPPPEGYGSWEEWLGAMGIPREDWNAASALVDPEGAGPRLFFQRVPEPKTSKNRVHLDVNVGAGQEGADKRARVEQAARRLESLGASMVEPREERGEHWIVMLDPEGNEFCVQ